MKGQDYEPNALEKLLSTWPLFAGLALVAAGLGYVWYCKNYPPHILFTRPVIVLCGGGVLLIMYWAFSNDRGTGSI
jgi:hypothetical protein